MIVPLIRRAQRMLNRFRGSHSQVGEDLIVARALRRFGITTPYYLDIGANDPKNLSNTFYFYERGASGVCVEANPVLCEGFRAARPRDKCLNLGVVPEPSGPLPFYVLDPHELSTFDPNVRDRSVAGGPAAVRSVIDVPTATIHQLVDEHCERVPDFLTIDIEGLDEAILRSIDFARLRPKVICVETLSPSPNAREQYKLKGIPELLKTVGYRVFADTVINTLFLAE